jgi:hypothetical protein
MLLFFTTGTKAIRFNGRFVTSVQQFKECPQQKLEMLYIFALLLGQVAHRN